MAIPFRKTTDASMIWPRPQVHLSCREVHTETEDCYFQYQKRWEKPFVHLCIAARQQMAELFLSTFNPSQETRVLDVGITTNAREDSNYFEKWYPYPDQLTCIGLDSGEKIKKLFPQLRYIQIAPGPLPFGDKVFDLGISSAVIEHVGCRTAQKFHITELLRVCRNVFITTPDRYFPIEPHTMLPLVHYLPFPVWRKVLPVLGRKFYATERNLNPLSSSELRSLFPRHIEVKIAKIKLLGMSTNLVAMTNREIA